MLELGRLVDRRRPYASWALSGCLFTVIALITSMVGHTWFSEEVSTVFLTVRQDVGLFSVLRYTLVGGGGTREHATVTQVSLSSWRQQLCEASDPTIFSLESSNDTTVQLSDGISNPFLGQNNNNTTVHLSDGSGTPNSQFPTRVEPSQEETIPIEFYRNACAHAEILQFEGLLTLFLSIACCVVSTVTFLDMRNAICIADSVEPHVAPFQQLLLDEEALRRRLSSTELNAVPAAQTTTFYRPPSHPPALSKREQTDQMTLYDDVNRHLGLYKQDPIEKSLQQNGASREEQISVCGDTTTDEVGLAESQHLRTTPSSSTPIPGGSTLRYPTVLAMRTIPSLDVELAKHFCETGRDSLRRCKFRLTANIAFLFIVILSWLLTLGHAVLCKNSIAHTLQGLGHHYAGPLLPISLRLSSSFYLMVGISGLTLLLIVLQRRVLTEDLRCLNLFETEQTNLHYSY